MKIRRTHCVKGLVRYRTSVRRPVLGENITEKNGETSLSYSYNREDLLSGNLLTSTDSVRRKDQKKKGSTNWSLSGERLGVGREGQFRTNERKPERNRTSTKRFLY